MCKKSRLLLTVLVMTIVVSLALIPVFAARAGFITLCVPAGYMLTESMVPAINPGDLMHVDCSVPFDELHVGDVVQFQSVDGATSHRIIGIQDDALITMGDNNSDPDYPVPKGEVFGTCRECTRGWLVRVHNRSSVCNLRTGCVCGDQKTLGRCARENAIPRMIQNTS